jgi:hypothetical protein
MSQPDKPSPQAVPRILLWVLVFLAVMLIAFPSNTHRSECACDSGVQEVQVICELDELERMPAQDSIKAISLTEHKTTFASPPVGRLSDPHLDLESPPPKRG